MLSLCGQRTDAWLPLHVQLPSLLTSIEGKGERHFKVEGSAKLPQVRGAMMRRTRTSSFCGVAAPVPACMPLRFTGLGLTHPHHIHFTAASSQVSAKDQSGSPTTNRAGGTNHSFEEAKEQVDKDLQVFLRDVQDLYDVISKREGADVEILLEVIEKCVAQRPGGARGWQAGQHAAGILPRNSPVRSACAWRSVKTADIARGVCCVLQADGHCRGVRRNADRGLPPDGDGHRGQH